MNGRRGGDGDALGVAESVNCAAVFSVQKRSDAIKQFPAFSRLPRDLPASTCGDDVGKCSQLLISNETFQGFWDRGTDLGDCQQASECVCVCVAGTLL